VEEGEELKLHAFIDSALNGCEWSASPACRSFPTKGSTYSIYWTGN